MDGPVPRAAAAAARAAGRLVEPPWRADLLIAGVLTANEVPWASLDSAAGRLHAVVALVQCALLAARRVAPLAVLAAVTALALALAVAGATPADDLSVPGLVAVHSAAVFRRAPAAAAAAVLASAGAGLVLPVGLLAGRWDAAAGLGAVLAVVVALGLAVRGRRRDRERLEAGRDRLARDVHDVVSQSMSVVAVQAAAAARAPGGQGPEVGRHLATIHDVARGALVDMHQILGEGRDAGRGPSGTRGLADLPDLVGRFRGAGQVVGLAVAAGAGDAAPAAQDLAYRAVQEGLANALRHAPSAAVDVDVAAPGGLPGGLTVRVRNDRPRPAAPGDAPPLPTGGRGLAGLRERAAALGATVRAGAVDGGFALVVEVPAPGARRRRPERTAPRGPTGRGDR